MLRLKHTSVAPKLLDPEHMHYCTRRQLTTWSHALSMYLSCFLYYLHFIAHMLGISMQDAILALSFVPVNCLRSIMSPNLQCPFVHLWSGRRLLLLQTTTGIWHGHWAMAPRASHHKCRHMLWSSCALHASPAKWQLSRQPRQEHRKCNLPWSVTCLRGRLSLLWGHHLGSYHLPILSTVYFMG